MRPYAPSDARGFFIVEHGPHVRWYRRSYRKGYDQSMRRYDAGRARQEEREIVRAELAEWREGIRAEESEQAATDLTFMIGVHDPCDDGLYDAWKDQNYDDYEEDRKEAERAQAWYEHEYEYEYEIEQYVYPCWEEQEALDRYEATGRLDPA